MSADRLTEQAATSRMKGTVAAYIALMKPRIILLLLITTVPAMVLAQQGWPPMWLVAATLLGGTLAAGGANAINHYLDRDIDEKMARTRSRPLPSGKMSPAAARNFGIILGVVSFAFLTAIVNVLAASLAVGAILFYVFVYTAWMKRSTPQNIVVGGAAGAVPVLVGWAAVTGRVGVPALVMFAIIFFWTPPHFWALALKYSDDYASAGVPMLPVVAGAKKTTVQILVYSVALLGLTVLLYAVSALGVVYLAAAGALGAVFVWKAVRLWRTPEPKQAMSLFKYSINYLAALFAVIAADQLIPV